MPICSDCDHVNVYVAGPLKTEVDPDHETYGNLKHPPFLVTLADLPLSPWGDLKIEGYLQGKLVKTVTRSALQWTRI